MSSEKNQTVEDKMAAGEFYRDRLIKFGYLSERERRRLLTTYDDLLSRFDPDPVDPVNRAGVTYFALLFGIIVGHENTVWLNIIIWSVIYWVIAAWVLREQQKFRRERNGLYWEWRGYRCDEYGRQIG